MSIQIGQTIAKLRHAQGITQEQLATAIGISAPAISKWETGQSYPDITLLPPLARFFHTTVDALLAYRVTLTDDDREALYAQISTIFEAKGWAAGLTHCETILHEYPTDATLRLLLSANLLQNMALAPDDAARNEARARQLAWLREAVAVAEGNTAVLARFQLAMHCLNAHQLDEADEILTALLELDIDPRLAMPTLRMQQQRYDDAMKLAQQNLLHAIGDAVITLSTLTHLAIKTDDLAAAQRYADAGDPLLSLFRLRKTYRATTAQARLSAAHSAGDSEALLAAAQQFAAGFLDLTPDTDSPFLDRLFTSSPATADARNAAMLGLIVTDFETNDAYDSLRGDPRFLQIIADLRGQSPTL